MEGAGAGASVDSAASSRAAVRAPKAFFLAMARLSFFFLTLEAVEASVLTLLPNTIKSVSPSSASAMGTSALEAGAEGEDARVGRFSLT